MSKKLPINKQVLNGFINQAVSHNKFLEEQEMWKKRRKHKKTSLIKYDEPSTDTDDENFRNQATSKQPSIMENKTPEEIDDLKALLALYKDVNQPSTSGEKWDHSGFMTLYPNYDNEKEKVMIQSSSKRSKSKRSHGKKSKKKSMKNRKRSRSRSSSDSSETSSNTTSLSSTDLSQSSTSSSHKKRKKRKSTRKYKKKHKKHSKK